MRLTVNGNSGAGNAQPVPSISPVGVLAALAAGLLLVFLLDQWIGSTPVQHLYYLPIIFAAVRFGFRSGIAAPRRHARTTEACRT